MSTPVVEAVLVDTDVFSYLLSAKNYARLYYPHVEGKLIAISFITVGELHCCPVTAQGVPANQL